MITELEDYNTGGTPNSGYIYLLNMVRDVRIRYIDKSEIERLHKAFEAAKAVQSTISAGL